jgi:hypothetical protein
MTSLKPPNFDHNRNCSLSVCSVREIRPLQALMDAYYPLESYLDKRKKVGLVWWRANTATTENSWGPKAQKLHTSSYKLLKSILEFVMSTLK